MTWSSTLEAADLGKALGLRAERGDNAGRTRFGQNARIMQLGHDWLEEHIYSTWRATLSENPIGWIGSTICRARFNVQMKAARDHALPDVK